MANEIPTIVRGKLYPSQKAAAKALGVSQNTVSQSLRRNGHCDNIGMFNGLLGNQRAKANPTTIFGLEFRSQKEAAEKLGVSRSTIRRFAAGRAKQAGREIVYLAAMKYMERKNAAIT